MKHPVDIEKLRRADGDVRAAEAALRKARGIRERIGSLQEYPPVGYLLFRDIFYVPGVGQKIATSIAAMLREKGITVIGDSE